MKKALIIATTAAVLGGSTLGYHAYARYDGPPRWRSGPSASSEDLSAYASAHIAALKAGLALTPDQEKLWPDVESALRDLAQKRIEQRRDFRAARWNRDRDERPDPFDRLRQRADRLSESGADLKRLADSAEPLYDSLDEAQKRRLRNMVHGMRDNAWRHHRREWRRYGDLGDEGRHMHRREWRDDRDRTERREWREERRERRDGRSDDSPRGSERL